MRGDDFSGRERAGDGELSVCLRDLNDFWMKTGADDEFCAGVDGGLRFGCGRHSAGAEEHAPTVFLVEFSEEVDRVGDGHGDFDDGDASSDHGLNNGVGLRGAACAEDGDEADAFDDFSC